MENTVAVKALAVTNVERVDGHGALVARFNLVIRTPLGDMTIYRGNYFETNDGKKFITSPSYANPKHAKGDESARRYLRPVAFSEELNEAITGMVQRALAKAPAAAAAAL